MKNENNIRLNLDGWEMTRGSFFFIKNLKQLFIELGITVLANHIGVVLLPIINQKSFLMYTMLLQKFKED